MLKSIRFLHICVQTGAKNTITQLLQCHHIVCLKSHLVTYCCVVTISIDLVIY